MLKFGIKSPIPANVTTAGFAFRVTSRCIVAHEVGVKEPLLDSIRRKSISSPDDDASAESCIQYG